MFDQPELKVPVWVGWVSWLLTLPAWIAAYLNGRTRARRFSVQLGSALNWDFDLWRNSGYAVPGVPLYWLQALVWFALIFPYFIGLAYAPEGWALVPVNLLLLPLSIYSAVHLGTLSYKHGFFVGQRQTWMEALAAQQLRQQFEQAG